MLFHKRGEKVVTYKKCIFQFEAWSLRSTNDQQYFSRVWKARTRESDILLFLSIHTQGGFSVITQRYSRFIGFGYFHFEMEFRVANFVIFYAGYFYRVLQEVYRLHHFGDLVDVFNNWMICLDFFFITCHSTPSDRLCLGSIGWHKTTDRTFCLLWINFKLVHMPYTTH